MNKRIPYESGGFFYILLLTTTSRNIRDCRHIDIYIDLGYSLLSRSYSTFSVEPYGGPYNY